MSSRDVRSEATRRANLIEVLQDAHESCPEIPEEAAERWTEEAIRRWFSTNGAERPDDFSAAMAALEHAARPASGPLAGPVAIGLIPTVAPYLIPKLVPYLKRLYPEAEVALREAVTDQLLDHLEEGALDAVVAALPIERDGIETMNLFADRFFMAVARNHQTVLASPLTQADLEADRLLLLEEGHCLRDQALALCEQKPKRNVVNVGATSMTTLLQMVANDMGMTLIPEMAVAAETARTSLTILPFAEPQPARRIGLCWRRSDRRRETMEALAAAVLKCRVV